MSDEADYRATWQAEYRKAYAAGKAHWRPELATPKAFAEFMQSEWAPPAPARILEAGCGDGLNAIYLARLGHRVTGVDISEDAIARARKAAAEQGVEVEFLCLDLVKQRPPGRGAYDLWVDIKTLHVLWRDADRRSYLETAGAALRPRGVFFLNCGLALRDVREHFPEVFSRLDADVQAGADVLDRDLPKAERRGIRCETLEAYCRELEQSGFAILHARREASVETGWGAVVVAQKASVSQPGAAECLRL
ncbi:MAG TPA: class I SAM-dependent methyltransferase [Phycisphaerae bacterium]|nr:class I SAM-dependent methyltransferase [Phycisphaerae bacterium]